MGRNWLEDVVAILVTGAGYIGMALLQRLVPTGQRVVAFDNFYSTARDAIDAALPTGAELLEGDVADSRDVGRAFDCLGTSQAEAPITVFHLAAQPSASVAAREPELTERSNLVGARVVLEAARERGARVVFGGSFRVYGDELAGQCVDECAPYGRVGDLSHLSKIYVEQLARMLEVPFASVRLGITYGLSPIMKTTPAFMTVPNLFCERATRGEALKVLEDRPMAFIHVEDAANALLAAAAALRSPHPAEQPSEGRQGLPYAERTSSTLPQANATSAAPVFRLFNAAPEVATIGQVARTVQQLMEERGEAARVEGATATQSSFEVRSALDFSPRYTLRSGLGEVLNYFRRHERS